MFTPQPIKPIKPPKAKKPKEIDQDVLAIDFDDVIHDRSNPVPGKRMGIPYPDAKLSIEILKAQGYRIVIHSCVAHTPAGYQAIADWMDYYKIPFHEITAVKPVAKLYIDDKALHHTNWTSTLSQIDERLR